MCFEKKVKFLLKPFYCIPLPKNLAPYVLDHLGYKNKTE